MIASLIRYARGHGRTSHPSHPSRHGHERGIRLGRDLELVGVGASWRKGVGQTYPLRCSRCDGARASASQVVEVYEELMKAHVPRLVVLFVARGAPQNAREDAVGLEGEWRKPGHAAKATRWPPRLVEAYERLLAIE